uniref:Reverse transcriptase domain-containing protein n=1 Tax=Tanacetum cinerariifolium TaxID=118510 RepID=A0A699HNZ7_TANCI|nr:hypothetical protein [Tanacetum cinerariifolium]
MTRSSTKELFTPFKNPEREFRSSKKLFRTLSLDKSSSLEFDLFSKLEEHSEEEVVETMAETIEGYMCKTEGDSGSGVTRPKIDAKDHFELKGQFLKELRDNTFSGSDHEDANEHIEKHNGTSKTRSTKTFDGLAAIQAQLNNLGREIKKVKEKVYAAQDEENVSYGLKDLDAYSIENTLRNDALSQKEKDPRRFTLPYYVNNVCYEKAFADLGASVSVMPFSTYLNLGLGELAHTKLIVELADRTVKHPNGIAKNILVGIELRRNRVDDLGPNIEEGEIVNEPVMEIVKTRYDFIGGLDDYPSNYDFDRKIQDMDPFLEEGIGDVIVREPFCKALCVEASRFDGIINIRDRDDSVTYKMVQSNPRFKQLTNKTCNKIPPLLKLSEQDMMNGISHSYQKLNGFYKGVLNLGPEFIRDAKVSVRHILGFWDTAYRLPV